MSREMKTGIDYTSRDYESIKRDMIAALKRKMPEYTDTSETDAGIIILECFAMGIDIVSFYQDNQANETMLYTCEQRRNALNWCRMFGYTPQPPTPAKIMQVFKLNAVNDTMSTTIPKGTVVKTEPSETQQSILFTTEEDLVIPSGNFGDEKDESGNYLYSVSAVQGTQIKEEILGSSTGTKNQQFRLAYYPVVLDSIEVKVLEKSNEWYTWKRVDSFSDSNYLSRHYIVDILDNNQAVIRFGDGNTGKIPPVYAGGIRVSYINGGGTYSNVAANKVTMMHTSNPLVASTFNPSVPYQMGRDKESLESIKINAPNYNRTKWGALTVEDFEDLMQILFNDILFVKAQADPDRIDDIDIYVMLKDGQTLSEKRIAEMTKVMDERKIVGADNILIQPMKEYKLNIFATLIVQDNYSQAETLSAVGSYLSDYFATGNFDISQDVSITDLESSIYTNINGVRSFRITSPNELTVEIPDGYVAVLENKTISVTGGV